MNNFFMGKQARIFIAGFCSALCIAALFFAVQPQAASGDDEAILRELKEMKEEISGFRQDFRLLLGNMGVMDLRTDEEKAADEAKKATAAEISTIIGDLRMMRSAALMYNLDNMNAAAKPDFTPELSMLAKYIDKPDKFSDANIYLFQKSADGKWWVGFNLKAAGKSDETKMRLKERADEAFALDIFGAQDSNTPYTDQDIVWMLGR